MGAEPHFVSGARREVTSITDHSRSYSSWRRHQKPVSLRPEWGAVEPLVHAPEGVNPAFVRRIGVVHDAISSTNALMPGPSRLYVAKSVPECDANSAAAGLCSAGRKSTVRKL